MIRRRLALLVVVSLSACAKSPRGLYLDALHDQTQSLLVSKDLGTALRMQGTYLSSSFRGALADERQRLLDAPTADHERFIATMNSDLANYHEVVFSAATSLVDAKVEFGESDDRWQLQLTADGDLETLITVYKIREPSALHEALYAHKNMWNDLWIARFERTVAAPKKVRLKVGSGYGHAEIIWTDQQLR